MIALYEGVAFTHDNAQRRGYGLRCMLKVVRCLENSKRARARCDLRGTEKWHNAASPWIDRLNAMDRSDLLPQPNRLARRWRQIDWAE